MSIASPNSLNFSLPSSTPFYSHGVDLTSVLQSPPYFEYDFEQGINADILTGAFIPLDQEALPWRFAQIQNPLGIQILENPETGNHFAKAFWQKGEGTEFDLNTQRKIQIYGEFGAHARQEEVWTFESFFPNVGFEYDNYPEIIVQLHGRPDECEFHRDPPMALEIKQDNIIVTWRNDERES